MGRKKILALCLMVIIAVCLCGFTPAGSSSDASSAPAAGSSGTDTGGGTNYKASKTGEEYPYEVPPLKEAIFHADLASGNGAAWIDTSAVSDGYVAAAAVNANRLKFQIRFGDMTVNYNLPSDGTPLVFPLVFGDGEYNFRIMCNVTENRYAEEYSVLQYVTLSDPFGPYLRPNVYVHYTADYNCVKKAKELAASAKNQVQVVEAIYNFIIGNVRYDFEKAATVQSGYVPDPDETLATGIGICFDYSALAAAMLRSLGIPTKEVHGYVAPNGLYHAWNMFYIPETGWVTVQFTAEPDGWCRMDSTFGAAGQANNFIGDGTNYSDVYYY